jgi:hypothetical protein
MAPDREQVQQTIVERLFWHTAERDDARVAEHLFHNKAMDAVYTLDEATLFDLFFHFLREIGAFELLENLKATHQKRQRPTFHSVCPRLSDENHCLDPQNGTCSRTPSYR